MINNFSCALNPVRVLVQQVKPSEWQVASWPRQTSFGGHCIVRLGPTRSLVTRTAPAQALHFYKQAAKGLGLIFRDKYEQAHNAKQDSQHYRSEALTWLRKAHCTFPNDQEIWLHLARLLLKESSEKEQLEAFELYQKLIQAKAVTVVDDLKLGGTVDLLLSQIKSAASSEVPRATAFAIACFHRNAKALLPTVHYFEMARDLGHPGASNELGEFFYHTKQYVEAMRIFEGLPIPTGQSCYRLACMYEFGKGVCKSQQQAVRYYLSSSEHGFSRADLRLVMLFREKYQRSCQQTNFSQCDLYLALVRIAETHSNAANDASLSLARLHANAGNSEKMLYYYQKAAKEGNTFAAHELGDIYYTGRVVSQDHKKAFQIFSELCVSGLSVRCDAFTRLAFMYWHGEGCVKDLDNALDNYNKALCHKLCSPTINFWLGLVCLEQYNAALLASNEDCVKEKRRGAISAFGKVPPESSRWRQAQHYLRLLQATITKAAEGKNGLPPATLSSI